MNSFYLKCINGAVYPMNFTNVDSKHCLLIVKAQSKGHF